MTKGKVVLAVGALLGGAVAARAQVQTSAPWRGAGPTPCIGSDSGIYKCPPAPQWIAVRAGRLFDSRHGAMLSNQVIVLLGERITDVGLEDQVKIPAGARVIDLGQATVLPGLIDAHTHMFDTRRPNGTTEATAETQFRYFESDYVAAQYASILHRPWKIIRRYRCSILKRTFDFSEHVASGGRLLCARRARRYFEQ